MNIPPARQQKGTASADQPHGGQGAGAGVPLVQGGRVMPTRRPPPDQHSDSAVSQSAGVISTQVDRRSTRAVEDQPRDSLGRAEMRLVRTRERSTTDAAGRARCHRSRIQRGTQMSRPPQRSVIRPSRRVRYGMPDPSSLASRAMRRSGKRPIERHSAIASAGSSAGGVSDPPKNRPVKRPLREVQR
jgi:hypothetical protein